MFNELEELTRLENKYTKDSIKEFIRKEWSQCFNKNEKNFELFVKRSWYLEELPKEDLEDYYYISNKLPMPSWKIYTIADHLKHIYGIELSQDDREYFEIALTYLYFYKKVPFENIKKAIENLIPLQDGFMNKFKSAKSLNTEHAKEFIPKMLAELNDNEI